MKRPTTFSLLLATFLSLPIFTFAAGENPMAIATLTGEVQIDYDGNCLFDGDDFNFSFSLRFVGSSGTFQANPGGDGQFSVDVNDGDTYQLELAFAYPYEFCPAVQTTIVVPTGVGSMDFGGRADHAD